MLNHTLTTHAETRMRQRGLRDADLHLILDTATQVAPDAYLMKRADAAREIAKRKKEIQKLEKLKDYKVIVEEGTIITLYRTEHGYRKRNPRRRRTR